MQVRPGEQCGEDIWYNVDQNPIFIMHGLLWSHIRWRVWMQVEPIIRFSVRRLIQNRMSEILGLR
jgi:hypothetical protein